jgi:hypothetical protein
MFSYLVPTIREEVRQMARRRVPIERLVRLRAASGFDFHCTGADNYVDILWPWDKSGPQHCYSEQLLLEVVTFRQRHDPFVFDVNDPFVFDFNYEQKAAELRQKKLTFMPETKYFSAWKSR